MVSRPVCPDASPPSCTHDQFFFLLEIFIRVFGVCDYRRPLWREDGSGISSCCWASPAQSLSGLLSAVAMVSFIVWRIPPICRTGFPCFTSPGNRAAQLYHQAMGTLFSQLYWQRSLYIQSCYGTSQRIPFATIASQFCLLVDVTYICGAIYRPVWTSGERQSCLCVGSNTCCVFLARCYADRANPTAKEHNAKTLNCRRYMYSWWIFSNCCCCCYWLLLLLLLPLCSIFVFPYILYNLMLACNRRFCWLAL
jgi:hypothetical protein